MTEKMMPDTFMSQIPKDATVQFLPMEPFEVNFEWIVPKAPKFSPNFIVQIQRDMMINTPSEYLEPIYWCKQNCIDQWDYKNFLDFTFYFISEIDVTLFKLFFT
jgi:hypothetical protein